MKRREFLGAVAAAPAATAFLGSINEENPNLPVIKLDGQKVVNIEEILDNAPFKTYSIDGCGIRSRRLAKAWLPEEHKVMLNGTNDRLMKTVRAGSRVVFWGEVWVIQYQAKPEGVVHDVVLEITENSKTSPINSRWKVS